MWPNDMSTLEYDAAKKAILNLMDAPPAPKKENREAFQVKLLSFLEAGPGIVLNALPDGSIRISQTVDELAAAPITDQHIEELHSRILALEEEIKDLKDEVFND